MADKKLFTNFFRSFWKPVVLAGITLIFPCIGIYFNWPNVPGYIALCLLGLSLLLILAVSIFQFTKKLWGRAVLNLLFFIGGCIGSLIVISVISFASMFRQAMHEEISTELPVDKQAVAQIRNMCETIRTVAAKELEKKGFSPLELTVRSISFIEAGDERYVEVSYFGKSSGASEWHDLTFFPANGKFEMKHPDDHFRSWSVHESNFPKTMQEILEGNAKQVVEQKEYSKIASWPINESEHDTLKKDVFSLLDLYISAFGKELTGNPDVTGRLDKIEYEISDKKYTEIRVSFEADGSDLSVSTGIILGYKDGRFHFKRIDCPGWNDSTKHITDASNSAMDNALVEWLKVLGENSLMAKSSLKQEEWQEESGELPGGIGEIVLIRKHAHPFLAEYDRKLRLELVGSQPKTLRLPMNTGGRTNIRIFMFEQDGKKFIRLKDHSHMDVVISLDEQKFWPVKDSPDGKFIGAFMAVVSNLQYVDVSKAPEKARQIFQKAKDRGYEQALETFEAMKEKE